MSTYRMENTQDIQQDEDDKNILQQETKKLYEKTIIDFSVPYYS